MAPAISAVLSLTQNRPATNDTSEKAALIEPIRPF
jgi:hypothetical protein